jgi:hypothetical protein
MYYKLHHNIEKLMKVREGKQSHSKYQLLIGGLAAGTLFIYVPANHCAYPSIKRATTSLF